MIRGEKELHNILASLELKAPRYLLVNRCFFRITVMFLKAGPVKSFSSNSAISSLGSHQKGCLCEPFQMAPFSSSKGKLHSTMVQNQQLIEVE